MLSEEQTTAGSTTQNSPQTVLWEGDGGLCQRAWVEIDLAALTHNVKQLKNLLSPQTELMAVVKADAYGHGAVAVSQTVLQAGASWLGVATIPEGIELREAGIEAPILLLGATHTAAQVRAIAQWHLQPTICTAKQALIFSEVLASLDRSLAVHAKLDTGMSRLGTPASEATEFVQLVKRLPNLKLASIYSHLATADSPDPAVMTVQHDRFKRAIEQIQTAGINPPRLHLANSAAALSDPDLHYDLVRVGLATYGIYPAPHLQPIASLQPAMQVKARITQVKTIAAGTGVSYGYQFIASQQTQIAVVGIGYADGIPRNLSNKIQVLVRGKFVPQIGAVTMDQLMLDVSAIPDLEVGEVVTLLGKDGENEITADDWAAILGTISWEILCGFKHRLPRVAVNS
ncbi:alanine racemase [Tychonema sp. LEGE 07199]|uniref:alanine racemase n=1 Tax=unclassified Tychonema TaxID=2642144 RepID=UPI00187E1578|nr:MULTISPECIES: alanine racemase [unclassified Tychonema]MBE9120545.1 alanine racemase [Tychonema sp. LEGE 07199]MBE9132700.1 alanine racemase [Tychonema sp. LEGE 07196]